MKPFTSEEAATSVESLETLIDEMNVLLGEWSSGPTNSSQGVVELKSFHCSESVMTAFSQGTVLAALARDQSKAFIRTVSEPAQTFAPWTSVRAVLESSALGAWLLDPDIDVGVRVQRSLALRFEGLVQASKFVRNTGNQTEIDRALKRIDDVEQEALNLGYPRVLDKWGKRIGIGQEMPSTTKLVKEVLDNEGEYRLLSAVAHGHQWALIALGFTLVDDQRTESNRDAEASQWSVLEENTRLLEQCCLSPNNIVYLSVNAASAIAKPFWFMCRLFGWDSDAAKNLLEKNSSRLRIKDNRHFWRS